MARGWESKSVEDQINERNAEAEAAKKKRISPAEAERRAKRDGVLLARARTVTALETTRDPRYRALLERTLAHLNSELVLLEFVGEDS